MRALLFLTNFNLQHRILVTSVVRGMCKIKFVFNMGLKPVLKIEPPADRRAAQRKTHFVRCAARARSKIAIYKQAAPEVSGSMCCCNCSKYFLPIFVSGSFDAGGEV